MAHTVPFRLNKPAQIFQAGDYTGFGIRTGVKYQDPKTKEEKWTNWQAVIFAKSQAQIDFYTANLIPGALAVVSGEKVAVEQFQGNNGLVITLSLLNANVEAITTGRAPDAAQQAYARAAAAAPQPQAAPQQPAGFDDFDDDIPF